MISTSTFDALTNHMFHISRSTVTQRTPCFRLRAHQGSGQRTSLSMTRILPYDCSTSTTPATSWHPTNGGPRSRPRSSPFWPPYTEHLLRGRTEKMSHCYRYAAEYKAKRERVGHKLRDFVPLPEARRNARCGGSRNHSPLFRASPSWGND